MVKQQVKNFIAMLAPIAQRQAAAHGNKIFPSVCIAQACCESAYGTSPKMINANAVFGIKMGGSKYHFGNAWHDKAYNTRTKECYDGRTYTEITDMFRAYESIEDAVCDYFDLLTVSSRYKYALNQPTPQACIEGIQRAPYATSPNYVQTIMSIIKTQNLTQYDPGGITVVDVPASEAAPYSKGDYVVTNGPLRVRSGPGTKYPQKAFSAMTSGAQKLNTEFYASGAAFYKVGAVFTALSVEYNSSGWWAQTPSGYVCIAGIGKVYCRKK